MDRQIRFVYDASMDVEYRADAAASLIAATIGVRARSRMLYCLVDGRARTSTELSVVAEVSPSTASIHLKRLAKAHLVKLLVHGKYRSYSLAGPDVANALEALSVLAGASRSKFVPSSFSRLRVARTCYDHMAGIVAVSIHDRFQSLGWLSDSRSSENAY
ncbi:MAG TPA: helix-turn-helix domain-containing protein, partial [Candidatus Sulfotelmatobacter sp.]